MNAFITGITGFAGSFLAEKLISDGGYSVSGTYLSDNGLSNLDTIKEKVNLYKVDLQNYTQISGIIKEANPEIVFHLAALASAADSFKNPSEYITNNIAAQVNLLEAIRTAGIKPKILIVSSAEVYGDVDPSNLPIDENTPIRPVNPYGVSKIAQDFMGLQYFISYGLHVVRVRPFNHIGPRQSPAFVVAHFAKEIAEIEKGNKEPILRVGNLEAKRDFTDVRDMVELYSEIILEADAGDVYNAGSGYSVKIEDVLSKLLALSNVDIKVESDPTLFRPIDTKELICNNSKIIDATGWTPKIYLEKTLSDTLDYWRSEV